MVLEDLIESSLKQYGRAATFLTFTELNNLLFLDKNLLNGKEVAKARTKIYDLIIKDWFSSFLEKNHYSRPFALVVHGGTGREEMVPYSDIDMDFIVDDSISEDNHFINALRENLASQFEKENGFSVHAGVHNLDDIRDTSVFDVRQINSFLDARALFDTNQILPHALASIREYTSHFNHFVHNIKLWEEIHQKYSSSWDNLHEFNIKDGRGGLRHVLAALRIQYIER